MSSWTPPALKSWLDKNGKDVAALLLRVGFAGFLAMNHGWGKLMSFGEKHGTFPDPLHITPTLSMAATIGGELVFPLLVLVGAFTRLAALPTVFTLGVAALFVHSDSVLDKGEHALLYVLAFAAIALLGPGRFSVDGMRGRA
jgi:putative oxidoreductase